MRPFGITVSLVATLAIAAVVVNCSSDSVANDPLLAPDGGAAQLGNMSFMNGGGWSPTVEAASNDKVSVCHSGNGKHWVQLNLSAQGARAHLGDPSTGKGGHAGDFRVSQTAQCPPPASNPGAVQICKVAGPGVTAGTNYSFTVTANNQPHTVTVAAGAGPTGTCASAGTFSVGTSIEVRETAQQGITTSSIVVNPAGAQQGTSDLAGRSAVVIPGTGTTTVTFTNTNATGGATGTLAICKVAGSGVTVGTNYTFAVGGQTATVGAGNGPTGTCTATPLTVSAGNVTVTENATSGVALTGVTAVATGGGNALVSSDFGARSAVATVTAGQLTTVTFTNTASTATGTLVICKIGGTGVAAGTIAKKIIGSSLLFTAKPGAEQNDPDQVAEDDDEIESFHE